MNHEPQKRRRLVQWHTAAVTDFAGNIKANRAFINHCLQGIPRYIGRRLLNQYAKRYDSQTAKNAQRSANIYLRESVKPIKALLARSPFSQNLKPLHSDEALELMAKNCAEACQKVVYDQAENTNEDYSVNVWEVWLKLRDLSELFRVGLPTSVGDTALEQRESAICRLCAESWWMGRLTKARKQTNEQIAILAGMVRKGIQPYASNQCVYEWSQQQARNAAYLEMMDLVDEDTGERYNLAEIAAATTANPEKRRIELMVRIRGLEDLADEFGYQSFFVTWTAPSKHHPSSRKYNGSKPNETQKYLCAQWAKARAAIKRQDIRWFGVRVAEPHADACPHWHMLVFVHPHDVPAMETIISYYALEHDADEKGAKKQRIQFEDIDRSKGSATGYIAKYISKNINASHLSNEPDFETGNSSLGDAVKRVTAWASCWNIRQFQFFGAESVSVWRECRRMKEPTDNPDLEKIRSAADHAKWSEFTKLIKANPVKLAYDFETRNNYGEAIRKIIGLFFESETVATRQGSYRLERRQVRPWSPVNNCTGFNDSVTRAAQSAGLDPSLIRPLAAGAAVIDGDRGFKIIDNELRVFE